MKKVSIYPILFLLMLFAFKAKGQQLELQNLNQPNSVCLMGSNQNLVVAFKNVGAVPVTFAQFETHINGLMTGNMIWNGVLNPGNSTTVNLGSFTVVTTVNDFLIIAYDANSSGSTYNDTALYHVIGENTTPLPYVEDFEGTIKWAASNFSAYTSGYNPNGWELAVPNYGIVTPTGPGSKAWVVGLDSGYDNNILTYLYSPLFNFSASGINSLWLHFTANSYIASFDNVTVQYSTDLITWTTLSGITIPANTGGWAGYGTGLSFLASEPLVQFRFVFNSNNNGTADGIAIDDFEIIQCVISQINMNLLSPISCAGACDGVLEASPQSGLPPYTYLWDSGETTQTISNICAGTYNVTVTDANGCSGTSGLTINQPQLLIADLGFDQFICDGTTALLCPNVFGGTPPYLYTWNTGAISSCISVTTSGVYAVTVMDGSGCTASDDIVITVNAAPTVNLGPDVSICSDGSIMLDAGSSGNSYQWSDGSASQTITVIAGGVYTVVVTDFNGCTGSDDIVITQLPPIVLQLHEVYNCATSVDSIYVVILGGSGPYTYSWSNFQTSSYLLNPGIGTYTVAVTDVNGCTGSGTANALGALDIVISKMDPPCNGFTGIIGAGFNGVPPFNYLWSNGATVINQPALMAGTYTVTISDAVGCSLSKTDSLVEPDPIVLTVDSVIAAGCAASDGGFFYSFSPGAFSIPWVNGVQFAPSTNLAKGVYNIYIIQNVCASNTVTVVVPDSCVDVWPGDANYDLVADNKDLLQIGLAYGNTGPIRTSASSLWVAQPAADWSNWFNIGVNQKHADCDGNGVIDAADTIPILANYGLTHLLKPASILQVNTLAPDLYLTISNDTTGLSDSVFVNVMCGTAANPVDSIYGLAFRLYYDSALVDTASISFNSSATFLGTNGVNLISINKNFGAGYADFAITRTDHLNASGHGPITVMGIVTTDNVTGKFANPVNTVLQFSIGNVSAITANENPIVLDAFGDSIYVDSNLTAINYLNWDAAIKVFPNPANNYFTVASSLTNIQKISMLNQFGEVIYKNQNPHLPQHINVSSFTNGIYFLRIETKYGVMYKKIEVIK